MGVDEMFDGIGAERREGVGDCGFGAGESCVDEEFAVMTGEDGDVAAGAHEDADIAPEMLDGDLV